MRSPDDTEFARFARTREPAALAAVFDRTAPNLLLVAMHLCKSAADAEDLVQTVFLQAIRDADAYDPEQPVLPWLLTILQHRAHDLRRAAHRRRERSGEADGEARRRDAPDRLAASAETLRQVAAALEALPKQYREVLTLRLVHDLRAVDIARAQGTSPETVRTRLRRGLRLLRRALPAGIATPALLALLATESLRAASRLPAIRQHVLRAVPTTAAAVAAGGAIVMKLLLGGIAVAAASLLWVLVLAPRPIASTDASARAPSPAVAAAAGDLAAGDQAAAAPGEGVDREVVPTAAPPEATTTTIRGRVVAAESGKPLAGATAGLQGEFAGRPGQADSGRRGPEVATSDRDGTFAIRSVPPPDRSWFLGIEAKGRMVWHRDWPSLRQGIEVDLGDVALEAGTEVRFAVRDEQGAGWAGAQIELESKAGHANGWSWRIADAGGAADFGALRAGGWSYSVRHEMQAIGAGEFTLPPQDEPFEVQVRLPKPPPERCVAGRAVDTQGVPVADLELEIPVEHGCWPVHTRADGSFLFCLPAAPEGDPRFRLRLPNAHTDLELVDDGGEFAWGRCDLRVVVRRRATATLTLTVVGPDGEPVEQFSASCGLDRWQRPGIHLPAAMQKVAVAHHGDGRLQFLDLPPGPYRVTVLPAPPWCAAEEIPFEIAEGRDAALRIELARAAELPVAVVDRDDRPLADVTVHLGRVVPEDGLDRADLRTVRVPIDRVRRIFGERLDVLLLDTATTDAEGGAVLRAAPRTPALVAIVEGDRCLPQMLKDIRLPPTTSPLRITVDAAASLHGRIRPVAVLQKFGPSDEQLAAAAAAARVCLGEWLGPLDYGSVEVRAPGEARPIRRAALGADGTFRCGSLPVGRFELWLQPGRSNRIEPLGPLAVVDLRAGEDLEVQIDATNSAPGRITGRFFVDGVPWPGTLGFARCGGGQLWGMAEAVHDGRGTCRSPWLLPGTYVPFVEIQDGARAARMFGSDRFPLAPGAELEITTDLHRRRVAVTLLDADGKPAANRTIVAEPLDHPELAAWFRFGPRTDAKGLATVDPAPRGRLLLRAYAASQDPQQNGVPELVLGELGAEATEATLRLPR